MAGSKSNYLSKALLDNVLGGWTPSGPTGASVTGPGPTGPGFYLPYVWVGLWTTAGSLDDTSTFPTASATEVSGGGYSRVQVANNSSNWPAATGTTTGLKQNNVAITFPTATAAWGTINQFALLDASTLGNILFWGDLTSPKVIGNGDTASFSAGALTITED